jgi:predicted RNase H-like nuclease
VSITRVPRRRTGANRADPVGGRCAGVDGCRGGWVVATREGITVEPAIAVVVDAGYAAVAIDMPIGLPSSAPRRSEIEARRYLAPRGSTVFPTPARACLAATDYRHACELSMAARNVKLSKQSWHILGKIAEVDRAVTPAHSDSVVEAHPECSFLAMNGEQPLASKHTAIGIEQRLALVEAAFGIDARLVTRTGTTATVDDVLDAYAVLWTAERFAAGLHLTFPAVGQDVDERGLPMRIVR